VAERGLKKAGNELAEVKDAMEALNAFYGKVSSRWASRENRVLDHVTYTPPIQLGFGADEHTQDYAIVDTDLSKIRQQLRGQRNRPWN
jgi:hypothetical protein